MKTTAIILLTTVSLGLLSCNNKIEDRMNKIEKIVDKIDKNTANDNPAYKLYATSNLWNFLKLDTRNGKITMVQFSIDNETPRFEYQLSDKAQCDNNIPGRFTLQPTENRYNFIMIDQVSGQTYQVQWNFDEDKRFVIPIN